MNDCKISNFYNITAFIDNKCLESKNPTLKLKHNDEEFYVEIYPEIIFDYNGDNNMMIDIANVCIQNNYYDFINAWKNKDYSWIGADEC